MVFADNTHDPDSCMDVWQNFYRKIYPPFFGDIFDFSELSDVETSSRCRRWYIKLRNGTEARARFPKFKIAGDCIFNFNEKKIAILGKKLTTGENIALLNECAEKHHSYENFAFLPISGGMNRQKGMEDRLDRPDVMNREILRYFRGESTRIFDCARGNREALEWYLSLFDGDIMVYMERVYQIRDKAFVTERFLPFADITVTDEDTAVRYMKLAQEFWSKREI